MSNPPEMMFGPSPMLSDGVQEGQQMLEVGLLRIPERHMATFWADRSSRIGHHCGHLLHVLRVHFIVLCT